MTPLTTSAIIRGLSHNEYQASNIWPEAPVRFWFWRVCSRSFVFSFNHIPTKPTIRRWITWELEECHISCRQPNGSSFSWPRTSKMLVGFIPSHELLATLPSAPLTTPTQPTNGIVRSTLISKIPRDGTRIEDTARHWHLSQEMGHPGLPGMGAGSRVSS